MKKQNHTSEVLYTLQLTENLPDISLYLMKSKLTVNLQFQH